jgi:hypothetical protein
LSVFLGSFALLKFQQSGGSYAMNPGSYIRRSNRKPNYKDDFFAALIFLPAGKAGCLLWLDPKAGPVAPIAKNKSYPLE